MPLRRDHSLQRHVPHAQHVHGSQRHVAQVQQAHGVVGVDDSMAVGCVVFMAWFRM
jgi:hypothetical protein